MGFNQQNDGFIGIYPLVMVMAISYDWWFLWDYTLYKRGKKKVLYL